MSQGENPPKEFFGVGEILNREVGARVAELRRGVGARGNTNRAAAVGFRAIDIERRIADDRDTRWVEGASVVRCGACHRDGREVPTRRPVGAKRAKREQHVVVAGRADLDLRRLLVVSREEPDRRTLRVERRRKFGGPRHATDLGGRQRSIEFRAIGLAELLVCFIVRQKSVRLHEATEEEPIERARDFDSFKRETAVTMQRRERAQHRRDPHAFRAKERAVDIEKNKTSRGHASAGFRSRNSANRCDDLARRIGEVGRCLHARNLLRRVREDLSRSRDVGALEAHDERHLEADGLRARHDCARDLVALHDAAEDVDEDALHVWVAENDAERFRDGFFARTAANVEEVRRFATVEFDDVHRCHREACAVHEAADVAIERDVGKTKLVRADFRGILFVWVEQLLDRGLAEERVVIELELRIEREHATVGVLLVGWRDDERIDFDEARVLLAEDLRDLHHDVDRLADLLALEAELECDFARLERLQAQNRVQRHLEDGCGVLLRNDFDLDATFSARDERGGATGAIHGDREVVLLRDLLCRRDEKLAHDEAFRTRLIRNHLVGQHEGRCGFGVGEVGDEFDETCLATTTSVHLALDDDFLDAGVEEFLRLCDGIWDVVGDGEGWDGDARFSEQLSGLILVDLHGGGENIRPAAGVPQPPRSVYSAPPHGQVPERPKGTVC